MARERDGSNDGEQRVGRTAGCGVRLVTSGGVYGDRGRAVGGGGRGGLGGRGVEAAGGGPGLLLVGGGHAALIVGVDGGQGTEEEAINVGEDGGAASGDAIGGEKFVKAGEGEVDALGGLEVAPVGDDDIGKVGGLLLFVKMLRAEAGRAIVRKRAALAACGSAIGTASGEG